LESCTVPLLRPEAEEWRFVMAVLTGTN
jgi:hypothetical protein